MCGPRGLQGEPDHLFHNNGDGTFTDVSVKAGVGDKATQLRISPRPLSMSTTTVRSICLSPTIPRRIISTSIKATGLSRM